MSYVSIYPSLTVQGVIWEIGHLGWGECSWIVWWLFYLRVLRFGFLFWPTLAGWPIVFCAPTPIVFLRVVVFCEKLWVCGGWNVHAVVADDMAAVCWLHSAPFFWEYENSLESMASGSWCWECCFLGFYCFAPFITFSFSLWVEVDWVPDRLVGTTLCSASNWYGEPLRRACALLRLL